jgi:hypothetical protein
VKRRISDQIWKTVIASAMLLASATPSPALSEFDSTTANITATIASGIGVVDTNDMVFTWMARPASPGAASLSPANQIMSTSLSLTKNAATSPARVVVAGSPNQALGLIVGERASFGQAGRSVSVSGFTYGDTPVSALGPDGRATFHLGATLFLTTGTTAGRYRGMFDVIVTNN